MKHPIRVLLSLLTLALALPAYADVTLSPIFSDNAVLQREMPIPIWGWDNPGQEVTVTLDADTKSAKADATGHWSVKLDPKKAGGPYDLTVKGSSTANRKNILIGEVWFCSGQSNMVWQMTATTNIKEELENADRPQIRMITIPNTIALNSNPRQWIDLDPPLPDYGVPPEPGTPVPAKPRPFAWQVCNARTLPNFSGVAYHFGKNLNSDLNVPVGLITSAWGGTYIEAWISKPALLANPVGPEVFKRQLEAEKAYPDRIAQFKKDTQTAIQGAKDKAATQPATTQPVKPNLPKVPSTPAGPNAPAVLYNGMVAPIAPYAIRGAIWYQGEANAYRPAEYQTLLASLITDWRKTWGQGDFPVFIVQLPSYTPAFWAPFRIAQANAVKSVPNADYAVTIDVGENANVHPRNKKTPGYRLAMLALKSVYGKTDIIDRGPTFAGMKADGSNAIVTFENTGTGLITKDGKAPALFEIAGKDQAFFPATAKINGTTIVLSNPRVPAPAFVRFCWSGPITGFNLYNKEEFPAAPFNTDPALTMPVENK